MKRTAFVTGLLALAVSQFALAHDNQSGAVANVPTSLANEIQDVVFLADHRPILIRFHVRIDGRPFREAWDDYMDSLFKFLDTDGDGVLSDSELARAPKPQFLGQMLRQSPETSMNTLGRTPDLQVSLVGGKVTREGLATYYRLAGVEPFRVFLQDRSGQADVLTEALFKHLDADLEGKLSKDKLLAADTTLRRLDLDDDEMISLQELLPNTGEMEASPPSQEMKIEPLTNSSHFVVLSGEESSSRLAFAILRRYDKDKNDKLSQAEICLDKAVFDRLDANHDGELTVQELSKFAQYQPADIELLVDLGNAFGSPPCLDVFNPGADRAIPEGPLPRRENSPPLVMALGSTRMELRVDDGMPANLQAIRQSIIEQFQKADEGKQGYLTVEQAKSSEILQGMFALADRNGDGQLTLEELTAFVDLQSKAATSSAVLMITDQGRSMFDMLDSHHDGRLRQNDLKTAWARLAPWMKNGIGQMTKGAVPHQFQLVFRPGRSSDSLQLAEGISIPAPGGTARRATAGKGPLWFQKMDRNGDGYVSPREFLGTKEDFQRIDTNGDGLISVEEAERADALMRKAAGEGEKPQK